MNNLRHLTKDITPLKLLDELNKIEGDIETLMIVYTRKSQPEDVALVGISTQSVSSMIVGAKLLELNVNEIVYDSTYESDN